MVQSSASVRKNQVSVVDSSFALNKGADEVEPKLSIFEAYKNTFYGILFALLSSLMITTSNILTKKASFFNGFDISFIRYATMFLTSSCIAKYKGMDLFSRSYPNKILYARAMSGLGMIIYTVTLKLIDPSDAVSLFATNIIYIAILSRIFFHEKFTILHIVSLFTVFGGVILITQPAFLFNNFAPQKNVPDVLLIYDLVYTCHGYFNLF